MTVSVKGCGVQKKQGASTESGEREEMVGLRLTGLGVGVGATGGGTAPPQPELNHAIARNSGAQM